MRDELLSFGSEVTLQGYADLPGQLNELGSARGDPDPSNSGPGRTREHADPLEPENERRACAGDLRELLGNTRVAVRRDLAQEPQGQVRGRTGMASGPRTFDVDRHELSHGPVERSRGLPSWACSRG